jgi:putative effector of murein hydrolase LrgA (UPF0299 family)
MAISFIPPTLQVLQDRQVTTGELNWLIQELMLVIIVAVMMTGLWRLVERGTE